MEVRRGPKPPVEEGELLTGENVYDRPDEPRSFFPWQVTADLTVSAMLFLMVVALSWVLPAPLTEPADLTTTTYVPRPEWFFFFYDQMLMFFPGYALISVGGVIVPLLFFTLMVAVPWLDKEPGHSLTKRPFAVVIAFLVTIAVVFNMLLTLTRIANFPG